MRRILVIGAGGAGKSVFADTLGSLVDIEVLHLDKFYWRPGWVETPKSEWLKTIEELLERNSWIMDGNYSGTIGPRIAASDTVIFLDMPRLLCIWRVLKRAFMYRNKCRPDMAEGCREKLSMEFILWVWRYPKRTRPKIVDILKANAQTKRIVWLRSDSEVKRFLESARLGLTTHSRAGRE